MLCRGIYMTAGKLEKEGIQAGSERPALDQECPDGLMEGFFQNLLRRRKIHEYTDIWHKKMF